MTRVTIYLEQIKTMACECGYGVNENGNVHGLRENLCVIPFMLNENRSLLLWRRTNILDAGSTYISDRPRSKIEGEEVFRNATGHTTARIRVPRPFVRHH